jgi:peptidylprolyl isomerase
VRRLPALPSLPLPPSPAWRASLLPLLLPLLLVPLAGCGQGTSASGSEGLGGVSVQGGTGSQPTVRFPEGFAVESTQVKTLVEGKGPKVGAGDSVTVEYVGVNGRTGQVFDSSWQTAQPVTFPLGPGMISGFNKALAGQTVGSRVLAAIPPEDGYGSRGNPQAGIKGGDTLVFVVDIRDVVPTEPQGTAVPPPAGLPHLATTPQGVPVEFHETPQTAPAPDRLEVHTLIKGEGPPVQSGDQLTVNYLGQIYPGGQVFDQSYSRGQPATFEVGVGSLIPGWDRGLVGVREGSRVVLVVPPDQGYGARGNPQAGIAGDDTLIFVVDVLDAS